MHPGCNPVCSRLQPYVSRLGCNPVASRRAVEEKLLRLEQTHAAALGELARCRAAATQGWDEPEP